MLVNFLRLVILVSTLIIMIVRDCIFLHKTCIAFTFSCVIFAFALISAMLTAVNAKAWLPLRLFVLAIFLIGCIGAIMDFLTTPCTARRFAAAISLLMSVVLILCILVLLLCLLSSSPGKDNVTSVLKAEIPTSKKGADY